MSVCCFTGHRVIPRGSASALTHALDETLSDLYARGVRIFRAGGAMGFDTLAAARALLFRKTHPDCRLELILPCRDQDKNWREEERACYRSILQMADKVTVLYETYCAECMHARNRALVDGSDVCVAFLTKNRGGTLYTCSYAMKKGLELINLAYKI